MTPRISKDQAYARGFAAAKQGGWFSDDLVKDVEESFAGWREEFPLSAGLDYRAEIVKLWNERLAAEPDPVKFPECRGLGEINRAEHEGYLAGCGGDRVRAAYHFNYYYFLRLRLQTRYFGFPPERMGKPLKYGSAATEGAACTAVWFEDSPDGPLNGKNLDSTPRQRLDHHIPHHIPNGEPIRGVRLMGTGSAAVLCDEEPDEIFPVKLEDITPEDIRTVREYVPFRYRYRQFCGPSNGVFVDQEGGSVVIEQSNCRMGWRYSEGGISAVTALAYTTPELQAFKLERDRLSLQKRGWGEDAPDWVFWRGCDARYRRLMKLAREEAKRGPTLEGLARMLLDPGAEFPERISVANERFHKDVVSDYWTVFTWATVVFGPDRRTYWWAQPLQPKGPIFQLEPELHLGEGVEGKERFAEEHARMAAIGKRASLAGAPS